MGRRATDDEAAALYRKLNPDPKNERVWIVHNGSDGLMIRRNPYHPDVEEWQTYRQGSKYGESFQGEVESAITGRTTSSGRMSRTGS